MMFLLVLVGIIGLGLSLSGGTSTSFLGSPLTNPTTPKHVAQSGMKKRVDKPIEEIVGEAPPEPPAVTHSYPSQSSEGAVSGMLPKLAHDNAISLGFTPKAIVARKDTIITNPLNWGIVLSITNFPIKGQIKPIGVRWAWQGSQTVVYDWHHYSELVLIHKTISDEEIKAKLPKVEDALV